MLALSVEVWKQHVREGALERVQQRVVFIVFIIITGTVEEAQRASAVVQLDPDPAHRGPLAPQGQGGRRRGHGPQLPVPGAQGPEAVLWPRGDLHIPGRGRGRHAQEPVPVAPGVHGPMVASPAQRPDPHDLRALQEALRDVWAPVGPAGIAHGGQVVGQDEVGVGRVGVKGHRSW